MSEVPYDPEHPYVRRFVGCGHGKLFSEYCRDCVIVSLKERYLNALKTVRKCRDDLHRLDIPLPRLKK